MFPLHFPSFSATIDIQDIHTKEVNEWLESRKILESLEDKITLSDWVRFHSAVKALLLLLLGGQRIGRGYNTTFTWTFRIEFSEKDRVSDHDYEDSSFLFEYRCSILLGFMLHINECERWIEACDWAYAKTYADDSLLLICSEMAKASRAHHTVTTCLPHELTKPFINLLVALSLTNVMYLNLAMKIFDWKDKKNYIKLFSDHWWINVYHGSLFFKNAISKSLFHLEIITRLEESFIRDEVDKITTFKLDTIKMLAELCILCDKNIYRKDAEEMERSINKYFSSYKSSLHGAVCKRLYGLTETARVIPQPKGLIDLRVKSIKMVPHILQEYSKPEFPM